VDDVVHNATRKVESADKKNQIFITDTDNAVHSTPASTYASSINTILTELNNLSGLSVSELTRRHIDPLAYNTLLSAQTKLAKVTQEMLSWKD